MLWPPRDHGRGVDDSGWPWMTVACAFLLAVDGGGKGERWWWWLRLRGLCWSCYDLCHDGGGGCGGGFVVNVAMVVIAFEEWRSSAVA